VFAGMAPYFVGLYQVNFQMPSEQVASGLLSITVGCGGRSSQANIAVASSANWQTLASGTVGSGGGTVSATGLSLAVPAGALPSDYALSVYQKPGATTGMEAYRVSQVYVLSGLPETINSPITLTLAASGQPDGETYVLLSDITGAMPGTSFLKATVQGGQLSATIPASGVKASADVRLARLDISGATKGGISWMVYALRGYKSATSDSGRFVVHYAGAVSYDTARALGRAADQAYNLIRDTLGLDWNLRKTWPLEIFVYEFTGGDVDKWGESGVPLPRDSQCINLNSLKLAAPDALQTMAYTVGHELFHVMQTLMDPRPVVTAESPWLWFAEASSTWLEHLMTTDASYIPGTVRGENYSFLIRHALEYSPGDQKEVQNHGYGASMFLHSPARAKGHRIIGDITRLMAEKNPVGLVGSSRYSPVEAMQMAAPDLGEQWRSFCRQYIAQSVYSTPYPSVGEILGLAKGPREVQPGNGRRHFVYVERAEPFGALAERPFRCFLQVACEHGPGHQPQRHVGGRRGQHLPLQVGWHLVAAGHGGPQSLADGQRRTNRHRGLQPRNLLGEWPRGSPLRRKLAAHAEAGASGRQPRRQAPADEPGGCKRPGIDRYLYNGQPASRWPERRELRAEMERDQFFLGLHFHPARAQQGIAHEPWQRNGERFGNSVPDDSGDRPVDLL
jgi:hypothetical protein